MQKILSAPLALSILALILLVTNVSLVVANRSTQRSLAKRQETVMQNQPVLQLGQAMVRMIADAAVKGDTQMRSLLTSEGINLPDQTAKK
ncbi:MAG: hypothetical protein PHW76_07040 [Alphaproteobacteria bacterium]|nr:hypothetical protein [Alphaproteobacteria bacterium]